MSRLAADLLARFLRAIEGGAAGPPEFACARTVFLGKTTEFSLDPLDNRVVFVCSAVYRRWAALRLRHLGPWVAS